VIYRPRCATGKAFVVQFDEVVCQANIADATTIDFSNNGSPSLRDVGARRGW
jgi:hypothetical protein